MVMTRGSGGDAGGDGGGLTADLIIQVFGVYKWCSQVIIRQHHHHSSPLITLPGRV